MSATNEIIRLKRRAQQMVFMEILSSQNDSDCKDQIFWKMTPCILDMFEQLRKIPISNIIINIISDKGSLSNLIIYAVTS
jgi:hypothetical protein